MQEMNYLNPKMNIDNSIIHSFQIVFAQYFDLYGNVWGEFFTISNQYKPTELIRQSVIRVGRAVHTGAKKQRPNDRIGFLVIMPTGCDDAMSWTDLRHSHAERDQ